MYKFLVLYYAARITTMQWSLKYQIVFDPKYFLKNLTGTINALILGGSLLQQ